MDFLRQAVEILTRLLITLIFARVLISWLAPHSRGGVVRFIKDATDPIMKPIQRILPNFGPLDLSPLVALLLIELIRKLILMWI